MAQSKSRTMSKYKMVKHPLSVFGTFWHPNNGLMIATGCLDGKIRVFNDGELAVEIKAHDGKIFNLVWNPCFDSIIATSSDDKTVGVWDVNTKRAVARLRDIL